MPRLGNIYPSAENSARACSQSSDAQAIKTEIKSDDEAEQEVQGELWTPDQPNPTKSSQAAPVTPLRPILEALKPGECPFYDDDHACSCESF